MILHMRYLATFYPLLGVAGRPIGTTGPTLCDQHQVLRRPRAPISPARFGVFYYRRARLTLNTSATKLGAARTSRRRSDSVCLSTISELLILLMPIAINGSQHRSCGICPLNGPEFISNPLFVLK